MLKFFVPNLKKTNIMIVKHDLIGIYEILENDKLILISQADVVSYQYNHMKVKPYEKEISFPKRFCLVQLIAKSAYKTVERVMKKIGCG